MRWLLAMALVGCGASSPSADVTTPGAAASLPDPTRYAHHARVPLEAGELLLGAESPTSDEVALVLRAPRGALVLFACDLLEAETAVRGFELGSVAYENTGDEERLGGVVPRRALRRLATEAAPRIHTCDEEIALDDRAQQLLRAFVEGSPPPAEERLQTRSIALEGLEISFAVSNLEPDVVRLSLRVVEPPIPLGECDLAAIVAGEAFPLGVLSLRPGGPNPHRHDRLEARLPRVNVQRLSREEEASLLVCGDVWLLDRHTLENIRSLVGDERP